MYGVTITMRAPVETYDRMHAEMTRRAGTAIDGLLVHIGRAYPRGSAKSSGSGEDVYGSAAVAAVMSS